MTIQHGETTLVHQGDIVSNGTLGVLPTRSRSIRHWEAQPCNN